jgi:hypothetical protein
VKQQDVTVDELLVQVHTRISGGIDIQTYGGDGGVNTVELRWRRDYGDDGLSAERFVSESGPRALSRALRYILLYEDEVDRLDAAGVHDVLPVVTLD